MPSTVISSFRYERASKILCITFVSGAVYEYKEVPEEVYLAMKESKSKGIFFNNEIKDQYDFERKS